MNIRLFNYEEIVYILEHNEVPDYELVYRWFGSIEDYEKDAEGNYCLSFSEECIDFENGDYWLLDYKNDTAEILHNLDNLKENIFELLGDDTNE